MKKMLLMIVAVIVLGTSAHAAFNEDFDTFSLGALTAQESWEAHATVTVETTATSGEYTGGRALKTNSTGDEWPRHDSTGVALGLTLDQDGIEYGFDVREDNTSAVSAYLFMRQGRTANYGAAVGLGGGYFAIRPNATSGDTITGNWVGADGGAYWEKGDWLRIKIRLTGTNFSTATVYCYNLTKSIDVPTGITGYDTGINYLSKAASWTGLNLRLTLSTGTYVDNLYIEDYTAPVAPTPSMYIEDFESETLGSINQTGWRDNAPAVTIVSTSDSGEYVGGAQAMKSGSTGDEWPQYALDRFVDPGLQVGTFDGIEMGFDFREDNTSLASCRMHFRVDVTSSYSPAFGLNVGNFAIRENGDGGTTHTGNAIGSAGASLWEKGDWVRLTLVLTGTSYSRATLYAYNLDKGVEIPTGLESVSLAVSPQINAADWSRLVFRMGNSSGTYVDNAYVTDYVNTNVLAENPTPADGEYPVAISGGVTLSWDGAPSADSHKVYFGTASDELTLETDTTSESYLLPYTLEKGVTYYWRIDEVIAGVDNEGMVWSFTTELGDLNYPRRMAYEGFDYDQYVALKNTSNGGFGWETSWERSAGGWCYLNVGPGSLTPAMDYLLGTNGNRIQHPASTANDGMRELSYPIDARADQDYYISYLAMGEYDGYNQVNFAVYESKSGAYLFQNHMFYTGYSGITSPQFALRDPSGAWNNKLYGSWASDEVYVVVVKISATATGDDTVSVSVFDATNPLPATEPTVWDESFTTQSDKVYPWISISGRSDAYDLWNMDEIHVGTGWGAVTGWAEACGDFGTLMAYDLNEDCYVDLGDYALMASDWFKSTDPSVEGSEWVIEDNDPNFTTLFTDLDASQLNVYETDTVTVDGNLSEWSSSRWYNTLFTSGYQTTSVSDVTDAEVALKWDPANPDTVYMALKVTDTNQSFAATPDAWNAGDNIEIRFSVNDTSSSETWLDNETFDTAQYYQIFPQTGGFYANLGPIGTAMDAEVYTDIEAAVSVDGDIITYEIALPVYSSYDINSQSGTSYNLTDSDVVAFNLQINSVNGGEFGGLFADQGHAPDGWPAFTVTLNSSLPLGAFGFFDADLDENGMVGLSDLDTIILKWLSCTDPEGVGCDQPWMP
ncbi:MAG: hypothetical protein ACIAQZ_06120 [Sedimentisphaeraceae bacterium JB056]